MKNTTSNKIKMFGMGILVAVSMIGCVDDSTIQNEKAAWSQDVNSAMQDSGLNTVACTVDNVLVGNRMTGQNYCE